MNKIKLFTHKNLDGYSLGLIFRTFHKDDLDVYYQDDVNLEIEKFIITADYEKYDRVYIIDLTVNDEVEKLIKDNKQLKNKLTRLDHTNTIFYFIINLKEE